MEGCPPFNKEGILLLHLLIRRSLMRMYPHTSVNCHPQLLSSGCCGAQDYFWHPFPPFDGAVAPRTPEGYAPYCAAYPFCGGD